MHLQKFKSFPYHIIGVILFFLSHGYSEYIGLIPFKDLFILFLWLLLAGGLIFLLLKWLLRSVTKSGILTTLMLGFYLFYGAISDSFKAVAFLSFLSHYRSLLSGFILITISLYFYFRQSAAKFQKVTLYLNTVFAVLIVYDLFFIVLHTGSNDKKAYRTENAFINNYTGHFEKRPDIYFIIMDEYSGSRSLANYWKYDNSRFENFLKDQGFFVAACPSSDYPQTIYSLASILSMDYLKWLQQKETALDFAKANKIISDNIVMGFLKSKGYKLYNYSFFDIGDRASRYNTGLFSFKLKLITSKTLFSRMQQDLLWTLNVRDGGKANRVTQKILNNFKTGNEDLIALTKAAADNRSPDPKFVYTHLALPHVPYLYDSAGKEMFINTLNPNISPDTLKEAYLQYLVYTNKVIARLASYILEKTNRQAVIILMSDHGYRGVVVNGKPVYANNNFNSIYIPGKNYKYMYDTISNVNEFRMVFNTLFEMKLPLLPDSSSCK